jgi:hypothetical protein
MRGIAREILQAAVGQLELIGKGKHIYIMGPCEGLRAKSYRLPWASST